MNLTTKKRVLSEVIRGKRIMPTWLHEEFIASYQVDKLDVRDALHECYLASASLIVPSEALVFEDDFYYKEPLGKLPPSAFEVVYEMVEGFGQNHIISIRDKFASMIMLRDILK